MYPKMYTGPFPEVWVKVAPGILYKNIRTTNIMGCILMGDLWSKRLFTDQQSHHISLIDKNWWVICSTSQVDTLIMIQP